MSTASPYYRYRITWGSGDGVEHYLLCRTWSEACKFMLLLIQEGREGVGVKRWEA